jgi:putative heme-binding domain-containing protein
VALKDGRVITGVVVSETDETFVIQTDKEQLSVSKSDVEETRNTGKSLMPDGMLDSLTVEQVRDLVRLHDAEEVTVARPVLRSGFLPQG